MIKKTKQKKNTAVKNLGLQSCATAVKHIVQNQTVALYYWAGDVVLFFLFCLWGRTAQ